MVNVGDKLQVEIAEIDARGKISLVPVQPSRCCRRRMQRCGRGSPRAGLIAWLRAPRRPARARTQTRVLERGVDGSTVTSSELPGGLRVVTESVPGARSASVGVWVGVGSVDETPRLAGASHYLEHLLFKGTRTAPGTRSPTPSMLSAASSTPSPRTSTPATTRACWPRRPSSRSAWSARSCSTPPSPPADVDTERMVILEEIAMRDDDPEDTLADAFAGCRLRRPPGRRPGDRLGRTPSPRCPAPRSPATTAAGTRRTRWSSPSPAASITPRCCAGCARPSANGFADGRGAAPAAFRGGRGRITPAAPGRGRRAGHRAGAPVRRGARPVDRQRPGAHGARRAVQRRSAAG